MGQIRCAGTDWLDSHKGIELLPQQRRVGFVFQDFALFPHMTVVDNVKVALTNLEPSLQTQRALDILRRVNLDGLENRFPSMLSGGQQQRVALARALAREPAVLLLDEPFSAVDQVTRRKLRLQTLQLTRRLNIPIILVTHDLDEAAMLADRMCVLHKGQTLQQGTPEEILERPSSTLVARLIDIRNLFEGLIVEQAPDRCITRIICNQKTLDAAYFQDYQVGDKVCWCISPSGVLLHSRLRPSKGEKENPLMGRITELITIGGISTLIIAVSDFGSTLTLELPRHVVYRNKLMVGDNIGVSLLKHSLHLMPWQRLNTGKEAHNEQIVG